MSRYRGTTVLDAPLNHPSRHLRLLVLDAWDGLFVLRGIEAPAGTMPFPGNRWAVDTDQSTSHVSVSGGAGGGDNVWHCEVDFDTSLPDGLAHIVVSPGQIEGHPAPSTTLATRAPSIARIASTTQVADDRRTPGCTFCNPAHRMAPRAARGPRCAACQAARHRLDQAVDERDATRPRVVAVSADLGHLSGTDIALCSLDAWPRWFDLTLGAQGPVLANRHGPALGGRWDIEDDHGNRYTGITTSGYSGTAYLARATCAPALDIRARSLPITFADPFGDAGIITTTVSLAA